MKILILNWRDIKNPLAGGAERVTFDHAKAWVKRGHVVIWFTSSFPGSKKKETIAGITLVRFGNEITAYLAAPFYYFFSKINFDLVIDEIHGVPFFTPLFVRKKKIAFIHEVAGDIWDYMYSFPLNIVGKYIESFSLFFYKNIQFWTDASSTILDLKEKGIPVNNCLAIPCPLENTPLTKIVNKGNIPICIYVSRLVRMKGVESVIKAFFVIQKKVPAAKLYIVGQGEKKYVRSLHKLVKDHKIEEKVTFFGYVTEEKKLILLRQSHLLLHASVKEGWGLVVAEAASQSTPSVVYDVPGLRDSVQNDKTGVVMQENSPEELAKQSLLLLSDKKRYIKYQRNCLFFARSLSVEKITNQSIMLIEKYTKKPVSKI